MVRQFVLLACVLCLVESLQSVSDDGNIVMNAGRTSQWSCDSPEAQKIFEAVSMLDKQTIVVPATITGLRVIIKKCLWADEDGVTFLGLTAKGHSVVKVFFGKKTVTAMKADKFAKSNLNIDGTPPSVKVWNFEANGMPFEQIQEALQPQSQQAQALPEEGKTEEEAPQQESPLAALDLPDAVVECDKRSWKIMGSLGKGGAGKVYAVQGELGDPLAFKVDIKAGGEYHTNLVTKHPLYEGMDHADFPECGILEALQHRGVSKSPRCYAACDYHGHNAVVMDIVDANERLFVSSWARLEDRAEKMSIVQDNVENLLELVRAKVSPNDAEVFIGKDRKFHILDFGAAMNVDFENLHNNRKKYPAGHVQSMLPEFLGIGQVAKAMCGKAAQSPELLHELLDLIMEAFCGNLVSKFDEWVVDISRDIIKKHLLICELNGEFLKC